MKTPLRTSRRTVLGLVAVALTGATPARAQDDPYGPVAAQEGICPDTYAYADRDDICVSRIGICADRLWICEGHQHTQFVCDETQKRPQRCCRKNWPPDPNGRSRGRCRRWHPKLYQIGGAL